MPPITLYGTEQRGTARDAREQEPDRESYQGADEVDLWTLRTRPGRRAAKREKMKDVREAQEAKTVARMNRTPPAKLTLHTFAKINPFPFITFI